MSRKWKYRKLREINIKENLYIRNREEQDPTNLYGQGMSDAEFRYMISHYMLEQSWYSIYSDQCVINWNVIEELKSRYKKNYKYPVDKKPEEISDREFRNAVIDEFLGKDWYVADSVSDVQVTEIAVNEILCKYSKRYKQEIKDYYEYLLKRSKLKEEIKIRDFYAGIKHKDTL